MVLNWSDLFRPVSCVGLAITTKGDIKMLTDKGIIKSVNQYVEAINLSLIHI